MYQRSNYLFDAAHRNRSADVASKPVAGADLSN
jgi:hypothetical protein